MSKSNLALAAFMLAATVLLGWVMYHKVTAWLEVRELRRCLAAGEAVCHFEGYTIITLRNPMQ